MNDPWAFGWTQALTITGFIITAIIAFASFRTFNRWRREQLESRRIEMALDALAMSYESKFIFQHIRGPMSFSYEWEDMPQRPHESDDERRRRGTFFATLKRVEHNKEFFERAWKMQARCAALFGPEMEKVFLLVQEARREIEVSAGMLLDGFSAGETSSKENRELLHKLRAAVWAEYGPLAKDGDLVGEKLDRFRSEIEEICRPLIDREFKATRKKVVKKANQAGQVEVTG